MYKNKRGTSDNNVTDAGDYNDYMKESCRNSLFAPASRPMSQTSQIKSDFNTVALSYPHVVHTPRSQNLMSPQLPSFSRNLTKLKIPRFEE